MRKHRIFALFVALCLLAGTAFCAAPEAKAASTIVVTEAAVENMVDIAESAKVSGKSASYFTGYSSDNCGRFAYGYCLNNSSLASQGAAVSSVGLFNAGVKQLLGKNAGTLYIKCSNYHSGYEEAIRTEYAKSSGCGGANVVIADSSFSPQRGDLCLMGWTPGKGGHVVIMTSASACVYASGNTLYANPMYNSNSALTKAFTDGVQRYYGEGAFAYFRFNTRLDAPEVTATANGTSVDVSWTDVGASSYYIYAVYLGDNTTIPGENVGQQRSYHYSLSEGQYRIYVTAVYSSDTMKTGWTDVVCRNPQSPTVQVSVLSTSVDATWNDVGADSYYVYIQNHDTGDIPFSSNLGKALSSHFVLSPGRYRIFVSAVYSTETKSGWTDFTCEPLIASVTGGAESRHTVDEEITLSVNAASYDVCRLSIIRTPLDEDGNLLNDQRYTYWNGTLTSLQHKISFGEEGYYVGSFSVTMGNVMLDAWVGWFVRPFAPDFIIPDAVTTIEEEAFQGCAFTYVKLGANTAAIRGRAFADCPNLGHISIPECTTAIAADAFEGAPAGLTIHAPEGSYAEFYASKHGYGFMAE